MRRSKLPVYALHCQLLPLLLLSLLLLPVSLASGSPALSAQQLNLQEFSTARGLIHNQIRSVTEQDTQLWIATKHGLNRYDGLRLHHYSEADPHGLNSLNIHQLHVDHNKRLWVATAMGMQLYDPVLDRFQPVEILKYLPKQAVTAITSTDEHIYFVSAQILYRFSDALDKLEQVATLDFAPSQLPQGEPAQTEQVKVSKLIHFQDYTYALTNQQQLFTIDPLGQVSQLSGIEAMVGDAKGVYLQADLSVSQLPPYTKQIDLGNALMTENHQQDGVLTLSNHRLSYRYPFQGKPEQFLGYLPKQLKHITHIVQQQQNIYLYTLEDGLYRYHPKQNLLTALHDFPNSTQGITPLDDGRLLMSSDASEIYLLDQQLQLQQQLDLGLNGQKQIAYLADKLYIASSQGFYIYDLAKSQLHKIANGSFTQIIRHQHQIILGSSVGKVSIYDQQTRYFKQFQALNSPILDLQVDAETGLLWLATRDGLYHTYDQTWQFNLLVKAYDQPVNSIYLDLDSVYLGNHQGLIQLAKDQSHPPHVIFNQQAIHGITGNQHSIYASTDHQLLSYHKTNQLTEQIADYKRPQNEYHPQAMLLLDEVVLLGGHRGVDLVHLKQAQQQFSKPLAPVQFSQLNIFHEKVETGEMPLTHSLNYTQKLQLKHRQMPFTIQFAHPEPNVDLFYRLEGYSEVYLKANVFRQATYNQLPPGEYTLTIYAQDQQTLAKSEPRQLRISIAPPWWFSVEAQLSYTAALLLLLCSAFVISVKRRQVQERVSQSEERLNLSLWGSGDEMWDWDIAANKIYRSNMWNTIDFPQDGKRAGHLEGRSNIHPLDRSRVRNAITQHLQGLTEHFEIAYRVQTKQEQWLWILDRAKVVERDEQNQPLRMTGTIKNIHRSKEAEKQLKLFESAVKNMSEGMFILDEGYRFVAVNDACCSISQRSVHDFMGSELSFDQYPAEFSSHIKQLLQQQGRWASEVEVARKDKSLYTIEITIDAIYDEQGIIAHFVGVFSDISARKSHEEELRQLTNNDLLTGLPNRSSLQVNLSNLVRKQTPHTLMVLDLDKFKKINDSLGHKIGDQLLILAAKRLSQVIPKDTQLYRLGGDEFALVIDKKPDIGHCASIAARILEAFAQELTIDGQNLVIGLSIGIVLYPEDADNAQALLRKADIAMYHAKSAGGNRYQFHSEAVNDNAMKQLEIENMIREGLQQDYFEVFYQPKYGMNDHQISGMEALVRLRHPQYGLINPSEFIPLAEETGLIIEIGELVLKKACIATQKWRKQGLFDGRIAVNLSSLQFTLSDLQQRIDHILKNSQLPSANLELEITEGIVIKQPEAAIAVMQQLSDMGISLALDDFGTGYSSLSYLKRFPIHTLKIDKAFVDDIDKSERDFKMVDSIVRIAHNMQLSVTAEGVEDVAQLRELQKLRCEEIQGYLYSKPLTEKEFTQLLQQQAKNDETAHWLASELESA